MKILVIGGTRFFGKRFVQLMLEQGHSVTILNRGQTSDDFGNRVTRIIADRTNQKQLQSAIKSEYDVVVDNILMNTQEADSIVSVLENRTSHYIMTSTLAVYDPKPGALYESDFEAVHNIPGPAFNPREEYQQGKRAAEHALSKAPFGVSIMRIPIIVGPDDYTNRLLLHLQATKEERQLYFPNPDAKFSYLHAQDAARALSWLCMEKPTGAFNISPADAWTGRELMACISEIINKKFVFGNPQAPISPFGLDCDYFMNTDKAKKAGFHVPSLEDWLPKLIYTLSNHL